MLRLEPSKVPAFVLPPDRVNGPKAAAAWPERAAVADFLSESDQEPLIVTSLTAMKSVGSNGSMPGLLSFRPFEMEPAGMPGSDQPGRRNSVVSIQGR